MRIQQDTITREQLAQAIRHNLSVKLQDAHEYVDTVLRLLSTALLENKSVKLRYFGVFHIKKKKARTGRNPKNGVAAEIKARKIVRFKTSPTLKKRINNSIKHTSPHVTGQT